jgi:hypothetical protein
MVIISPIGKNLAFKSHFNDHRKCIPSGVKRAFVEAMVLHKGVGLILCRRVPFIIDTRTRSRRRSR